MTTLTVPELRLSFPEGWSILTSETTVQDALEALLPETGEVAAELRAQLATALDRLLGLMRYGRVRALAAFHLVEHDPLAMMTATCAVTVEPVTVEPVDVDAADPLRTLAVVDAPRRMDAGHVIPFSPGALAGVRATLITPVPGETGQPWPMLGVARYALRVGPALAVLLHFETISLAYADDLLTMFDAIAGAVRLG